MTVKTENSSDSEIGMTLTRRGFVKTGGALFISFYIPAEFSAKAAENQTSLPVNQIDPTLLASWLEIRSDNTIVMRTGRTETGTGMSGYYPQVIAEELRVRPETISLIMGDTDNTPDGGYSAGFLFGMYNHRKVAAYAYQALLELAATQLGVPASSLTVTDGIASGSGKSISYGHLLEGRQLDLRIPVTGKLARMEQGEVAGLDGLTVTGEPPTKPVSQFKVIGTSYPMPGIPDKVTGKTQWSCDVTLPGMLHARMVRPATLGSTLISVGALDKKLFPTAEVVSKGNLVAVVSPNEWEAIRAAQSVAASTKWTDWSGFSGSEDLAKALRAYKWGAPSESRGKATDVMAALATAPPPSATSCCASRTSTGCSPSGQRSAGRPTGTAPGSIRTSPRTGSSSATCAGVRSMPSSPGCPRGRCAPGSATRPPRTPPGSSPARTPTTCWCARRATATTNWRTGPAAPSALPCWPVRNGSEPGQRGSGCRLLTSSYLDSR